MTAGKRSDRGERRYDHPILPIVPEVRFTRSGTVDLAYLVMGEGPPDIVLMIGWVSHLEPLWELPEVRHFLDRLSGMGRVALFDKRGTGLSNRPAAASKTPRWSLTSLQ